MIVGLGGYATAGKDAVADVLVGYGWKKTYMSKPLEKALLTLDPIVGCGYSYCDCRMTYSELHAEVGYDESKKVGEVRRLLQTLGTEVGRKQFADDLWVRLAFAEVDRLHGTAGHDVAITGIRFPNELEALHARGGVAVWVDRPGTKPANAHPSEHTLRVRDFDHVIRNDGDLEDLRISTWQFLARRA